MSESEQIASVWKSHAVVEGGNGMDAIAERVWEEAVRALAFVRVLSSEEVQAEADGAGGDVIIKSKDAEVVISLVEEALGGEVLVDISQLGRRELTSLRTLSELLIRRWAELHGAAA